MNVWIKSEVQISKKYWQKTTEIETPNELPDEIVNEVLDLWNDLKTGKAKNQEAKAKMITLYNTIHMTNYKTTTNCGSCISTCFDAIKKIYKKHKKG